MASMLGKAPPGATQFHVVLQLFRQREAFVATKATSLLQATDPLSNGKQWCLTLVNGQRWVIYY